MFLAISVNVETTPQKQYGFRYTLSSTSTRTIAFNNREPPSGSFYQLQINATIFIGGDDFFRNNGNNFEYWQQSVRLYLNYSPQTQNEFINLAIMDTGNILILQI